VRFIKKLGLVCARTPQVPDKVLNHSPDLHSATAIKAKYPHPAQRPTALTARQEIVNTAKRTGASHQKTRFRCRTRLKN
jgi:hypothetical protein